MHSPSARFDSCAARCCRRERSITKWIASRSIRRRAERCRQNKKKQTVLICFDRARAVGARSHALLEALGGLEADRARRLDLQALPGLGMHADASLALTLGKTSEVHDRHAVILLDAVGDAGEHRIDD